MAWRVVIVSSRSKLELKLNYLVVRSEAVTRIHIDEISVLLVENTGCAITASLLETLWKRKVLVIFCNHKHLPCAQMVSFYGAYDTSRKVMAQSKWRKDVKNKIWGTIIRQKIFNQSLCLKAHDKESQSLKLLSYVEEVIDGDKTNREGHAAKVYFNSLFGNAFSREDDDNTTNVFLDYGYSILLAAVAREITNNGYITQLGIFHKNPFNHFNLACDFMEPFRPIIDNKVASFRNDSYALTTEEKTTLVGVLNEDVLVSGRTTTLLNAMSFYVRSIFDAIENKNADCIQFVSYEF